MLKKKSSYVVAILGATGAVGKETLEILEERKFPIASLRLFASKRSAGEVMTFQGKEWTVEELTPESRLPASTLRSFRRRTPSVASMVNG